MIQEVRLRTSGDDGNTWNSYEIDLSWDSIQWLRKFTPLADRDRSEVVIMLDMGDGQTMEDVIALPLTTREEAALCAYPNILRGRVAPHGRIGAWCDF